MTQSSKYLQQYQAGESIYKDLIQKLEMGLSPFNSELALIYKHWLTQTIEIFNSKGEPLPLNIFSKHNLNFLDNLLAGNFSYATSIEATPIDIAGQNTFLDSFTAQLEFLNNQVQLESRKSESLEFSLSKDGTLSREFLGVVESYPIRKDSLRIMILKELISRKGFYPTKDLAKVLDTEERAIRKSINDIRKQVEKRFSGISGQDFIKGEQSSGYKMGFPIKILKS